MSDLFAVKPVLLWSDALIFVLVATLVMFFIHLARDRLTRQRWTPVFASPVGMGSFIVVMFYVLIAVLDSIHYREQLAAVDGSDNTSAEEVHYSQEVRSLLDDVLSGLKENSEKTYSAPFSIYSFSKENVTLEDGTVIREYPRLDGAGSHLESEDGKAWDIFTRSIEAVLIGLLISGALIALQVQWRFRCPPEGCPLDENGKPLVTASRHIPWKTLYGTVTALIVLTTWVLSVGEVYHILGTDQVGQDVLVQAVKAIRTGVLIGTLATLLTLPLAIGLGISAGYFKGWVDDAVQYIYTTLSSIPGILLIAASVLLIDVYIETHSDDFTLLAERADFRFLALCFILGMTSWTGLCRLLRAETLKVSQLDYVQAARAFGVRHSRIISSHILPNVTHIVLIALVLDFSGFVLAEAVLSYVGVGVDPSMASWGNMINEARGELSREPVVWWPVCAAFIMMFALVLAANLFADRVRDAFDPRAKG